MVPGLTVSMSPFMSMRSSCCLAPGRYSVRYMYAVERTNSCLPSMSTSSVPNTASEPISFSSAVRGSAVWERMMRPDGSSRKVLGLAVDEPAALVDLLDVRFGQVLPPHLVVQLLRDARGLVVARDERAQHPAAGQVGQMGVGAVAALALGAEEKHRGLHGMRREYGLDLQPVYVVPAAFGQVDGV